MKLIVLLFGLFSASACNSTKQAHSNPVDNEQTNISLSGTYSINSILNKDVTANNLEINFDAEQLKATGFSGCNRFFGSYKLTDKTITFGVLGSTQMFCNEDANNIETLMFETLKNINAFNLNGATIELISDGKKVITATEKPQEVNVIFKYSQVSRGSYKLITVSKKEISIVKSRDGEPIIKGCNQKDWNRLIEAFNSIIIETIPELEAPTQKRFYDGAAIANFTIIHNGETYETPSFDHGNPPQEIETIVKEILSISENIE